VELLPYVLFGAAAGVLIDRMDKRRSSCPPTTVGFVITAAIPLAVRDPLSSRSNSFTSSRIALGAAGLFWQITVDFTVVPALARRTS
jgi:hypothetical protein